MASLKKLTKIRTLKPRKDQKHAKLGDPKLVLPFF